MNDSCVPGVTSSGGCISMRGRTALAGVLEQFAVEVLSAWSAKTNVQAGRLLPIARHTELVQTGLQHNRRVAHLGRFQVPFINRHSVDLDRQGADMLDLELIDTLG